MSKTSRKVIIKESTSRRIIEQSRIRLLCVGLFFLLCFMSISYRMVEVAVLKNRHATITVTDPDNEKSEEVDLAPRGAEYARGDIVDRNGVLLATSLTTASLYANPKEIKDPKTAATRLEKTLGVSAAQIMKSLAREKSFVWIRRNLTPREQQTVNSLGIPGLYFQPEEKRVYPYANLTAHVLGYVGVDNKGLAGIEKYFDRRLNDGTRNHDPVSLSIDVRLQAIMRDEMRQAVQTYRAVGATGVIMDLQSGELLSMVSLPDFDPNKPVKDGDTSRFNRASLGLYEMGSTFKSFTMAAALENGVATMKSGYDATNPFKVASFTIQDSHPEKRWLTTPEIYAYSSNIGTAKMALDLGTRRQKEFLEKIGMTKPVAIELPERASPLYPNPWREINTVTISYGHGISVTPLHLVRGIAALVGGGTLPRLTLVKDGNKDRLSGERIVSEQTSKNLRRLLRLVVDHGTGSKGDVPGYRVGGKTGTAEKVQSGGAYNPDAKLASFVAVFPIDKPRYIVLVMIDEPKGDDSTHGYATGGWISAPVAASVISRMGPLLGLMPAYDVPEDDAEKFWAGPREPKPKALAASARKGRKYFHAAAY